MSWQVPPQGPSPQGSSPQRYSPDGRWYWDGSQWRTPPQESTPPEESTPQQPYWDGTRWKYPSEASPQPIPTRISSRQPYPWPAEAPGPQHARRRSYFVDLAIVLAALIVLGSVGSFVVIAIRNHHPGGPASNVPASAPSAETVFALPYTKRVKSAEFRLVHKGDGGTWSGSGVIEFAPEHAFSQTLRGGSGVFERDVEVGGVAYQEAVGSRYQMTDYELNDFSFINWDGSAPPAQLELSAQTTFDGQPAWVLKQAYGSSKWIVGKRTGDPLEAVIDGSDVYTFSHWGQAPAIQAPAAGDVTTGRYSGSGSAAVVAPAATVRVLKEKAAAGVGDPAGFRTIALLISYKNTSAASNFDNSMSLVSSDGVFASAGYSELSPSLKAGTRVAHGHRIVGWDDFVVPREATSFHLLFGEQLDQIDSTPSLDYLISISVQAPA